MPDRVDALLTVLKLELLLLLGEQTRIDPRILGELAALDDAFEPSFEQDLSIRSRFLWREEIPGSSLPRLHRVGERRLFLVAEEGRLGFFLTGRGRIDAGHVRIDGLQHPRRISVQRRHFLEAALAGGADELPTQPADESSSGLAYIMFGLTRRVACPEAMKHGPERARTGS